MTSNSYTMICSPVRGARADLKGEVTGRPDPTIENHKWLYVSIEILVQTQSRSTDGPKGVQYCFSREVCSALYEIR